MLIMNKMRQPSTVRLSSGANPFASISTGFTLEPLHGGANEADIKHA